MCIRDSNNGFVKYNQNIFSWQDQERLKKELLRASSSGANILLTNAAHESVEHLYKNEAQKRIPRKSVISGKTLGRVNTEELLVSFGSLQ